jgi:NADH:ubiquinone oxidoreductase subunit 2 (subunit N)
LISWRYWHERKVFAVFIEYPILILFASLGLLLVVTTSGGGAPAFWVFSEEETSFRILGCSSIIKFYLTLETTSLTLYVLAAGVGYTFQTVEQKAKQNSGVPNNIVSNSLVNPLTNIKIKGSSESSPHLRTNIDISWTLKKYFSKTTPEAPEAGLKYFIFGTISTGFLLFSLSFLYGLTGSVNIDQLAVWGPPVIDLSLNLEDVYNTPQNLLFPAELCETQNNIENWGRDLQFSPTFFAGVEGFQLEGETPKSLGSFSTSNNLISPRTFIIFCLFCALFIKLAVAPFHWVAPDVYEGAPTIITAYLSIVPKIAYLCILINLSGLWGGWGLGNKLIFPAASLGGNTPGRKNKVDFTPTDKNQKDLFLKEDWDLNLNNISEKLQNFNPSNKTESLIRETGGELLPIVKANWNFLTNLESEILLGYGFILICAILSIVIASFSAFRQTKIKRLLAYSSIGHVGFILLSLALGSNQGLNVATIYLILYLISTLSVFTIIIGITTRLGHKPNLLVEFSGLGRINPILSICLSLLFFSFAGIPPLSGFISKFLILLNVTISGLWLTTTIAIFASCFATYYYLRLIKTIWFDKPLKKLIINSLDPLLTINKICAQIIGFTMFITLTYILYPGPIMVLGHLFSFYI